MGEDQHRNIKPARNHTCTAALSKTRSSNCGNDAVVPVNFYSKQKKSDTS
jgi:hypothetical protein